MGSYRSLALKLGCAVRYYFTIKDGRTYPDHTGYVFGDAREAISYAKTIAAELHKEPSLLDSTIAVTDEQGQLIAEIAIATADLQASSQVRGHTSS